MARVQATNRMKIDNMPYTLTFSGSQRAALATMGTLGSSLVGAFSCGYWIRTTSKLTTAQYVIGCSNSSGGNYFFTGMTRSAATIGRINFQLRDASGRNLGVECATNRVDTGTWTHVVWTKDATNTVAGIKLYLNGVLRTLTTISSTGYADPVNFDRLMAIGSSLGSGAVASGWVGGIAQPNFFQRELTQQEVTDWAKNRIVPTTPFAGYLLTSESGAGTTVNDSQGNYNGTLTSAGQWSTQSPYKSRPVRQL